MPNRGPDHPLTRRLAFAALYLGEGAPIGYLWWAMPTKLRAAGMPVDAVAALVALLALPWAFKFLWAPAVDALRGPRWGLRHWVTVAQLGMIATLAPLLWLPLAEHLALVRTLLVAHAFCAATQDVAIDALAIRVVPPADRGRLNGWMQAGMLLGRAVFGGAALALESRVGPTVVVAGMLACIGASLAFAWMLGEPADAGHPGPGRALGFLSRLGGMLGRRATWLAAAVALLGGAAFEPVGGLVGPALLDQGVTQERIGAFLAVPVVACMVAGSLLGGWAADRFGHRRCVAGAIVGIAAWVGAIAGAMALAADARVLLALLAVLYLGIGVLTAASYALFMDLTDPRLGATQFSAFMGVTNLCEVWTVAVAGRLAVREGYATAFALLAAASLLALPFLLALRRSAPTDEG